MGVAFRTLCEHVKEGGQKEADFFPPPSLPIPPPLRFKVMSAKLDSLTRNVSLPVSTSLLE